MIPLEQLPPLQTIVFICKIDGIINDSEIVAINQEFCCPFCCEPVEIEFEEFLLKEGYRAPDSPPKNHAACLLRSQGLPTQSNAGLSVGSEEQTH